MSYISKREKNQLRKKYEGERIILNIQQIIIVIIYIINLNKIKVLEKIYIMHR